MTTVTLADFKNAVGRFLDEPLKEPVYITQSGRRVAVLLGADELERLITAIDKRQSYFVKDLPSEAIVALNGSPQAPTSPELDHLMSDE